MPQQPPYQSVATRYLARVLPIAGTRSRPSSWALALAMAATIIAFQFVMPPGSSVIFLYLLLGAQSVWFLGGRPGLMLTGGAVLGGAVAASIGDPDTSVAMQLWNVVSRLLSIGLLGFVLTGLRGAIELERWRSSTDHLTGALNRAAFEERLTPVMRDAEGAGEALVLAFLDLDGFKGVNDRHGHAAGNRVLGAFAAAAQAAIRASDVFARIGGDEFAALLRVQSAVEGDRVAELLHERLSTVLASTGYTVTCSMGALVMDARQMAREEAILDQADLLMYLAKQSGKNALRIGRGEAAEAALRMTFPREPGPRVEPDVVAWIGRNAERRSA